MRGGRAARPVAMATTVALVAALVAVPAGGGSPSLPSPSLVELEAAVREQLSARRAATAAVLAEVSASAERRAAAVGELGMHYHAYGLHAEAAHCYRQALALQPAKPRWWYYLAQAERITDGPAATRGFAEALARAPDYLPARLALVEAELAAGRFAEAENQLAEVLRREPRSAAGHFLRGQLAALRGDLASAARDYEAVLALEPWAASVRSPLATTYRRLGEGTRAQEQLALRGERRVSLPDPWMREMRAIASGVRTHLLRGAQAMRAGNLAVALDELARAVAADPADPNARLNLGAALAQAGRFDEARVELETAVALDLDAASRSKVHFNLGALALQQGRRDEAVDHLRQALAWDPHNEPARRQLTALAPPP